ncbi:DUF397 domain-containing protein [Streptomyces sp. NPDC001135]
MTSASRERGPASPRTRAFGMPAHSTSNTRTVEVAYQDTRTAVRGSRPPARATLTVAPTAFTSFIDAAQHES